MRDCPLCNGLGMVGDDFICLDEKQRTDRHYAPISTTRFMFHRVRAASYFKNLLGLPGKKVPRDLMLAYIYYSITKEKIDEYKNCD